MKVWSLKTGQVLGTFQGAHKGSVLCLKFEKDWSLGEEEGESAAPSKGILVSGSSDCSICVWDMALGRTLPNGEREVTAEVRAILEGHEGGVLDIRMDDKWIVSWSVNSSLSGQRQTHVALLQLEGCLYPCLGPSDTDPGSCPPGA